ncbi:MAG: sigma-54 dependent transcriptional regulator [Victivallaceae bacterium]
MLLRVKLAVEEGKLYDMLADGMRQLELVIADSSSGDEPWPLRYEQVDILIISEENIPEPRLENIKLTMQTPEPPMIIVLTFAGRDEQTAMLAAGCQAVLSLNVSPVINCKAISVIVKKFIERQSKRVKRVQPISEPRLSDFVSKSRSMQVFLNTVRKVVNTDSSLLILGETGVGKERLALAIHSESKRKSFPFIAINCAALPDNLLESELFGYEKGAFTGASRSRRGAFELAHKGTIFLDEIGDMPAHMQVKLLRALQERQFMKIGGESTVKVDVRVIAATNRDLGREVEKGFFRKDLYYRLSVIGLTIPPLSERREDIPELVGNYISYLAPRIGVSVKEIDDAAMESLINYSWPGNVRELINVIERALLLCDGEKISLSDMPDDILLKSTNLYLQPSLCLHNSGLQEWTGTPWKAVRDKMMDVVEKKYFTEMLAKHNGKVRPAAAAAKISPRMFYHKMTKHSIDNSAESNKV